MVLIHVGLVTAGMQVQVSQKKFQIAVCARYGRTPCTYAVSTYLRLLIS
jgi:hypothetical protein